MSDRYEFTLAAKQHRAKGRKAYRAEVVDCHLRAASIMAIWPYAYGPTPEVAIARLREKLEPTGPETVLTETFTPRDPR